MFTGSLFLSIPDLGSPISDPGSNNNKKGEGKINLSSCLVFFWSHKFHKVINYFVFEEVQKKFEPITPNKELPSTFYPNNCYPALSGWGTRDPEKPIQDLGIKKHPDPGFGSATLPGMVPSIVFFSTPLAMPPCFNGGFRQQF
jgi:hypothetical protein